MAYWIVYGGIWRIFMLSILFSTRSMEHHVPRVLIRNRSYFQQIDLMKITMWVCVGVLYEEFINVMFILKYSIWSIRNLPNWSAFSLCSPLWPYGIINKYLRWPQDLHLPISYISICLDVWACCHNANNYTKKHSPHTHTHNTAMFDNEWNLFRQKQAKCTWSRDDSYPRIALVRCRLDDFVNQLDIIAHTQTLPIDSELFFFSRIWPVDIEWTTID